MQKWLTMNKWTETLSATELDAYWKWTADLDANFAARSREWWESRTRRQCAAQATYARNCNDADGYYIARSYQALATD